MDATEADLRTALGLLDPLGAAFDAAYAALLLAALLSTRQSDGAEQAWADAARRITAGGYTFLVEAERGLAFPLVAAHLRAADPQTARLSAALLADLGRVPPPSLAITGLGRFEVRHGGRAIPTEAWRQRRAGELFRLLLVSPGRALTQEQVIEALWPDKAPAAAQPLLHHATSALRRALEPDLPEKFPSRYLTVDEGRIVLHLPPGSSVDFEAFEAHMRAGEWEAALAGYGGELFPEDRYADWAAAPRERLAAGYLSALLTAAEARLAAGRHADALDACRRALALDPWQERAVLLGMRACLALGDRAAALRLYRDLERTLREDLDIVPKEELQRLYEATCQRNRSGAAHM